MMVRLESSVSATHERERINEVLHSGNLSPIAQHVALFLHSQLADADGFTLEALMANTGWGKMAIRGALVELDAAGIRANAEVLCSYCGSWVSGSDCHNDHVVAKSLGGVDGPSNRVPACRACNSKKSDKPFLHWLIELSFGHHPVKAAPAITDGAAMEIACRDARLRRRHLAVLSAILDQMDEFGTCAPRRRVLASATGYTQGVVGKTVSELIGMGYLVVRRQRSAASRRAVAHYAFGVALSDGGKP